MHKYWALTKALLKNSGGMLSDGKTKKSRTMALYALLAICFLPTLFLLYMIYTVIIEPMQMLQLEGLVLISAFTLVCIIIFVFSVFLIPSIFYFSKDSDTLLALPLPPQTILAGKFSVCLLYEYLFTIAACLPMIIAYVQYVQPGILFYIGLLIVIILLPIYPLVLSSLITMLIMRFVPFFKNRDRFNLIGGLLIIVLAFAFSYYMNSPMLQNADAGSLIALLSDPDSALMKLGTWLFPAISFAGDALATGKLVSMLIFLAITAAAIFLFLFIGNRFYFKGAIGFNETGSSRKRFSGDELAKLSKGSNKILSYTRKELCLLFRTPVFFLNCIAGVLIFPILFVFLYFTTFSSLDLTFLENLDMTVIVPYLPVVGMGVGLFCGTINMIAGSAISREGQNVTFMKYIPMSLRDQIQAKVNAGILIGILGIVLMMIPLYMLFSYLPLIWYGWLFLCSLPCVVLINYLSILVDMAHPKLVWEQEATAVKQNLSPFLAFIGSILIIVPLGYLYYILPTQALLPVSLILLAAETIACGLLYHKMEAIAQHFFKNI